MKAFLDKWSPVIGAALAGSLGLKFAFLFLSGQAYFYIHPRLLWLAILGWTAILAVCFHQARFRSAHAKAGAYTILAESAVVLCLLALPVRSLDVGNKLILRAIDAAGANMTDVPPPDDTEGLSFGDWYDYFGSGEPRPELEGVRVRLTGFLATHDEKGRSFELGRMVVTCCVADGFVITFTVDASSAGGLTFLVSNAWYDVSGIWVNEAGTWRIRADVITPTTMPDDPYVYL
jgi:hypothetical protein